eukprot:PITA_11256
MEVKIQEEDKAITLLCSLPESWDHFVTSISLSAVDSLKFELVVGALLSEEVRSQRTVKGNRRKKRGVFQIKIKGKEVKEGETSRGKGDEDTNEAVEISEPVQQLVTLRRSTRERKTPKRYEDSASSFALITKYGEPSCYQEAVDDTDSEKWKMAMEEEMDSLAKNNTWDLVELPEGRSVVGCKWVAKLKWKVDGSIERYKARLVAKGYSQVEGIDFHEIFSLVVKLVSIHTVLALTTLLNLELEQLDVKTTFLHGDLDEELYMEQPEGFVQGRSRRLFCKLRK